MGQELDNAAEEAAIYNLGLQQYEIEIKIDHEMDDERVSLVAIIPSESVERLGENLETLGLNNSRAQTFNNTHDEKVSNISIVGADDIMLAVQLDILPDKLEEVATKAVNAVYNPDISLSANFAPVQY